MNNAISEIKKKTLEGITNRLDETQNQINKLEDKVKKNTQKKQEEKKRLRKKKQVVRELQDNMNHNNICIIGIPERE